MRIVALYPLIMAALGLLLYFFAPNPKLQEFGRLLIAAGLFAFAFSLATTSLRIS